MSALENDLAALISRNQRPAGKRSETSEIMLTIPGTPPGVNHYVKHTRDGRHYKTDEAERFAQQVALACLGKFAVGNYFIVDIDVYQGKGEKGDFDGYFKVPLDALDKCGAFRNPKGQFMTDAHVIGGSCYKFRDARNPRTVVRITGYLHEPLA